MADFTDMLADLLALGPKVGEFFLRKLYRCAYDVSESFINQIAELSRASVCELSSGGRVLASFRQLISSFIELILM